MGSSVVVIGNFDGVHPGHREVLAEARRRRPHLPLVVVTFWPHPVSVLRPDAPPMLLTSLEGRIELLTAAGADRVEVIPFTREFAAWSPAEFVERVIVPLDPALVVVGENFRFGHLASGNVDTLRELSRGRFDVDGLPLVRFGDEETCSTRIRDALAAGDVAHAAEHLGRRFRFRGVVAHGDRRGRQLGFPTANLPVPEYRASAGTARTPTAGPCRRARSRSGGRRRSRSARTPRSTVPIAGWSPMSSTGTTWSCTVPRSSSSSSPGFAAR